MKILDEQYKEKCVIKKSYSGGDIIKDYDKKTAFPAAEKSS